MGPKQEEFLFQGGVDWMVKCFIFVAILQDCATTHLEGDSDCGILGCQFLGLPRMGGWLRLPSHAAGPDASGWSEGLDNTQEIGARLLRGWCRFAAAAA